VTEQYEMTVSAPDMEAAIGVQAVTEGYGIEAIFDASDWEAQKDYAAPPSGAVLLPETDDYQVDADDTVANGRVELEHAQGVALARARTEILARARANRVSVGAVFDPAITLESTVRIETPSLVAQGKVAGYRERFDLRTGALEQSIEVAISRHGGAGIASESPLDPPAPPPVPSETPTARSYNVGVHVGSKSTSPPDDPDWDGYVCNAFGPLADDPSKAYRERFVLNMPEIEQAARNATEVGQAATYTVVVPQDELTLSY